MDETARLFMQFDYPETKQLCKVSLRWHQGSSYSRLPSPTRSLIRHCQRGHPTVAVKRVAMFDRSDHRLWRRPMLPRLGGRGSNLWSVGGWPVVWRCLLLGQHGVVVNLARGNSLCDGPDGPYRHR